MKIYLFVFALLASLGAQAREVLTTSPSVVFLGMIPVLLVAVVVGAMGIYKKMKSMRRKQKVRATKSHPDND